MTVDCSINEFINFAQQSLIFGAMGLTAFAVYMFHSDKSKQDTSNNTWMKVE